MRFKLLATRGRQPARARRPRSERDPKVRPRQHEEQIRVWSLLLPPGFPPERR
jgi:hypothetical protein